MGAVVCGGVVMARDDTVCLVSSLLRLYTLQCLQTQRTAGNRNTRQWISTRVTREFVRCVVERGTSWSGAEFQVEPVRLRRCSCRLWSMPYDSGIDERDSQGQRCHEAGKRLVAVEGAASATIIDWSWMMKMRLECGGAGQTSTLESWNRSLTVTF